MKFNKVLMLFTVVLFLGSVNAVPTPADSVPALTDSAATIAKDNGKVITINPVNIVKDQLSQPLPVDKETKVKVEVPSNIPIPADQIPIPSDVGGKTVTLGVNDHGVDVKSEAPKEDTPSSDTPSSGTDGKGSDNGSTPAVPKKSRISTKRLKNMCAALQRRLARLAKKKKAAGKNGVTARSEADSVFLVEAAEMTVSGGSKKTKISTKRLKNMCAALARRQARIAARRKAAKKAKKTAA